MMLNRPRNRWCFSLLAAFLGALLTSSPRAAAETVEEWVEKELPAVIEEYRHYHSHPELSFHEKETAKKLAAGWRKAGYEVTEGVGGHGVVALLKNGEGPTLMLRADLDALPVTEQTELVYASQVRVDNPDDGNEVGVMHACGHDIHIANLAGAARYFAAHRDRWQGTLMLIGQPAEERGLGAKAMIDDGLFKRFPKPDAAVALHVDAQLAAGSVGYRGGYALANVDSVDIEVKGHGGHGAYPQATVDPIVQAAALVLDLQTIVSREIKPLEPAVITVGSIHGGSKHNIIGDRCHLQLTVRSYSDEVRQQLLDGIQRKAKAIAQSYRAPEPEVTFSEGTPALWNDEDLAARMAALFRRTLGEDYVVPAEPSMGGEDFGRYGREGVPILMYRLGSVEAARLKRYEQLGQQPPSLHSPIYYPDAEPTLRTGLRTMIHAGLEILAKK